MLLERCRASSGQQSSRQKPARYPASSTTQKEHFSREHVCIYQQCTFRCHSYTRKLHDDLHLLHQGLIIIQLVQAAAAGSNDVRQYMLQRKAPLYPRTRC